MTQPFSQKITISEEVLSQKVSGETVILDLKSESYFGLDEVGTRIWQLLQESGDLQSAFDTILKEYDVQPDQLKTDFDALIGDLQEAGLITQKAA